MNAEKSSFKPQIWESVEISNYKGQDIIIIIISKLMQKQKIEKNPQESARMEAARMEGNREIDIMLNMI